MFHVIKYNNSIINQIKALTKKDIIYPVKELVNFVIVIPPITYLATEEHESKGQLNESRLYINKKISIFNKFFYYYIRLQR